MSKSVPLTALWGILLLTGFILLGRGFPVKAGNDAAGQGRKKARMCNKGKTRPDKPGRKPGSATREGRKCHSGKDDELQPGMSGRLEMTHLEILLSTSLIWPRNPKRTKSTTMPQSALQRGVLRFVLFGFRISDFEYSLIAYFH